MAYDTAQFENPRTGQLRSAPMGFSWTTFFFGPFPMLFRGSWKWFFIILITAAITYGLANLVWIFVINKLYLKDLVKDGFRLSSVDRGSPETVDRYAGRRIPTLSEDAVRQARTPSPSYNSL